MPVCTCRAGKIEAGDRVVFIVGSGHADWSGLPSDKRMMAFSRGHGGKGSSRGSDFREPVEEVSSDRRFFTLSPWPKLWAPCSAAVPYDKSHTPSCSDPLERFSHI